MGEVRLMKPGSNNQLINEYGLEETPPSDWSFLPAGDSAITRKVTSKGSCWRVQVKKGNRIQSLGLWAPTINIAKAKEEVKAMRSSPGYAKKQASAAKARAKKQVNYTAEFQEAIVYYLNFHPIYHQQQALMARLVTAHAIPIGSGTVARTRMIPIEQRAEKAVIAWMRHQTTPYDELKIARIKGARKKVRRELAQQSINRLHTYRNGDPVLPLCPLWKALTTSEATATP